jgi:hypothetical protein
MFIKMNYYNHVIYKLVNNLVVHFELSNYATWLKYINNIKFVSNEIKVVKILLKNSIKFILYFIII